MMNQYPAWKYVLIVVVLLVGMLYAMPNLYPSDPALQISSRQGEPVTEPLRERVKAKLDALGLEYKRIELGEEMLLVRFNDTDNQLRAVDPVQLDLGD